MANVNFILRAEKICINPDVEKKSDRKYKFVNDKNPTSIVLVYHLPDKRGDKLTHPTGLKIEPKYWNEKQGKVKDMTEARNKDIINNRLNLLKTDFDRELTRKAANGEPATKDCLKEWLTDYLNPKPIHQTDNSFHGYFKKMIIDLPTVKNRKTDKPLSSSTVGKFKRLYAILLEYERHTKIKLTWDNINLDFYFDFVKYLESKNMTVNTVGKYIRAIKYFMNDATDNGVNTSTAYKSHRFKSFSVKAETIYLNEDDLKTLETLDLSNNQRLDKIRDLFLVGCWTGLRFSDFTNIKHENIFTKNTGKYIEIKQQKTENVVVIPILPIVETILDKYGGSLPKAPTNQKFNEYIKEVGRLANFLDTIRLKEIRGGKETTTIKSKFSAISSHTARRSFASNMFRSGYSIPLIMAITGHKTEKTFMDYVKITPFEKAEMMQAEMEKKGMFLRAV